MDEKQSVIDVRDNDVRELSVTSGVARRTQRSERADVWRPANDLIGSSTTPRQPRARRSFGIGTVGGLLALSVVLLVVAIGGVLWGYAAQNDRDNAQHRFDGALNSNRNDARALAIALNNPDALFLPLSQRDPLHGAKAVFSVVLSGGGHGGSVIVSANSLPPLSDGHTWQVWIAQADGAQGNEMTPTRVTSGGLYPDSQGALLTSFVGLNDITPYRSVFVTEEGPDGAQTPTGAHLFEADIAKAIHLRDVGTK